MATIAVLPVRAPLPISDAAVFLGVTPLRLAALRVLGGGPRITRLRGRDRMYRTEDLEAYRVELYRRADISPAEMQRRLVAQRMVPDAGPAYPRAPMARSYPLDPFVDMASKDELVSVFAVVGLRVAIIVGLAIVVLSHTPIVWHMLRHGPYGDV